MLKYDHQLTEVKTRLPSAQRILIVLPQNLTIDNLAAGLTLFLSLRNAGKSVDIISTGTPLVSQSNLYGIGDVKNEISKAGAGNFVISLDGVVDTTGTLQQVPALENIDWYPENGKLNVVFHIVPGQRFEPKNITSKHEQSGYDMTFVVGCQSLNELGNLFASNSEYFTQGQVVNIDTNPLNAYFGFANAVDPQASSLSEIVAHILPSLTLSIDSDIASNIIAGIYSATNNLTRNVNPDTFMAVSQAVQVGGILPNISEIQSPSQPEVKIDYAPQPVVAQQVTAQQPPVQELVQQEPQPFVAPVQIVSEPVTQQPVIEQPQVNVPVQNFAQDNSASLQSSPFIVPPQDIYIPQSPITPEPQMPLYNQTPQMDFNQPVMQSEPIQAPTIPQGNAQGFDLRQIFQIPQMASGSIPSTANNNPPAINPAPMNTPIQQPQPQYTGGNPENHFEQPAQVYSSPEEKPTGEAVKGQSPEIESTPTPDWLVPKIFKGGNLG